MFQSLIGLILSGLFKRIPFIDAFHRRQINKMKAKYKIDIQFDGVRIRNFNNLEFKGFILSDEAKGFSLSAQRVIVAFSVFKIREASRGVSSLHLSDGEISRTVQNPPVTNDKSSTTGIKWQKTYWQMLRGSKALLKMASFDVRLSNITLAPGRKSNTELLFRNCSLTRTTCELDLQLKYHNRSLELKTAGQINRNPDSAVFQTDRLIVMDVSGFGGNPFKFDTDGLLLEFSLQHKSAREAGFSINMVNGKMLQVNMSGSLDETGFYIFDSSRVKFNQLNFTVFGKHQFDADGWVETGLALEACSMDDILRSFPGFCLTEIYTARFSGEFAFRSTLKLHIPLPFKYDFDLTAHNSLKLDEHGDLNLEYLKYPFRHLAGKAQDKQKEIFLDVSNPAFTPLEKISNYLKNAIILSEDRNFLSHKGVDKWNLGHAIFINLGTRKFTRGGSTITMQLMKNLYTHRDRTIKRKVEEMILAWLAQEAFGINKDRILELYLNVIQFAPDIYGVAEAAKFYFNKDQRFLSLTESLVLSYIVTRPRFFVGAIRKGSLFLAENLKKHIDNLSLKMLQQGLITVEEFGNISFTIEFSNGFGCLSLEDKAVHLHKRLQSFFNKASKLWKERHGHLPQPFLASTYYPEETQTGQNPHSFKPSLAFDIAFKNQFGSLDWSESLCERFARLLSGIDVDQEISWGGNSGTAGDKHHFELKNWKQIIENDKSPLRNPRIML